MKNLAITTAATSYTVFAQDAAATGSERKRQYAICKERGHVPSDVQTTYAIYTNPAQPQMMACKFCGCYFRFVTTLEESNVPK